MRLLFFRFSGTRSGEYFRSLFFRFSGWAGGNSDLVAAPHSGENFSDLVAAPCSGENLVEPKRMRIDYGLICKACSRSPPSVGYCSRFASLHLLAHTQFFEACEPRAVE